MDDSETQNDPNLSKPLSLQILMKQNARVLCYCNQHLTSPLSKEPETNLSMELCENVHEILLFCNFISTIPDSFFRPFVSLRVLNLAANELTQIPNLRGLSHLTELYLGHNKIEEIQHLDLLPQLQILDLKFNRIKTVDGLHNNHYLQKLSLSCNQLTSICSLPHLDKLSFLGLFGNSLHNSEEIETVLKIQCPNLETLFVSGNPFVTKVSHYRKILVFSLPKLKWLDWIYNGRSLLQMKDY